MLGISPRAVRYLIKVEVLKAEKHGRDWWITLAAVEAAKKRKYQGRGRPPKKEAPSK